MKEEDRALLKTIGIFNDSFPPIMDGVAVAAQNYAYWIHQKGLPVCVVTPWAPNHVDREPYPVHRYTSIPVVIRRPYRLGLPDIDLRIKETLDHIPFGIIHAHCPFSSGTLARRITKQQGIPLVATFHSKFKDDFERAIHSERIARFMVKEVIRFFKKADEVWIPQAAVEETIREYGFKGHVEVVDNGSDFALKEDLDPLKKAAREKLGVAEKELMFLFVGQHIWEKNPRLILEGLAEIKEEVAFKMFFIGTGYAALEMKALSDELGLSNKIRFEGMILNREKLKEYYLAADLFLFPSLYDNAPLVVREAAALETPSIMVKGSTAAEVVQDGVNGFLIDNTTTAFSETIKTLAATPERIRQAGSCASQSISRSWESVTDEVLDRYVHIIKRKNKKKRII